MTLKVISKAEGYDVIYQASKAVNFAGFDYRTVKQSLIDYIRMYHPESFTDFIESSELIAIIESFAYICELLAYRFDMNAHENTIEFAKRKDMVLRLARMISYNGTRVKPSTGLIKFDSISTTEKLVDSAGRQLSNQIVKWNDPSNPNWKEQFFLIFNKISQQPLGTVDPRNRSLVGSVLFEEYSLNVNAGVTGVIPLSVSVNSLTIPYEIVSTEIGDTGPLESTPESSESFRVLYGDDGMGDESSYTGIFALIKQGVLYKTIHNLSGVVSNQMVTVDKKNVNQTDVWLNEVTQTGTVNWINLTDTNSNVSYNSIKNSKKYNVDTLDGDRIRLVFGDGDFSENPNGTFNLWYRTSDPIPTYIPKSAIQKRSGGFTYRDATGRIQTVTFTYSLVESIQNGSETESIDHVRTYAPRVYRTQDRMVNASDYNDYPMIDPSILKLRTINRTFAGDSAVKLVGDSSGTYQDIKIFNDDGWLYEDYTTNLVTDSVNRTVEYVIQNTVTSVLSQIDLIHFMIVERGIPPSSWRLAFNVSERNELITTFNQITSPWPIGMNYNHSIGWVITKNVVESGWDILIDKNSSDYTIITKGLQLKFESQNVNFFQENSGNRTYTIHTATTKHDNLKLMKANTIHRNGQRVMFNDELNYRVLDVDKVISGLYENGLTDYHKLILTTYDSSGELVPDGISQRELFDEHISVNTTNSMTITTAAPYITGYGDVYGIGAVISEPSYTVDSISSNVATLSLNGLSPVESGSILTDGVKYYRVSYVDNLPNDKIRCIFRVDPVLAQGNAKVSVSVDLSSIVTGSTLTPRGILTNTIIVSPSTGTVVVKSYVYQNRSDGYYTASDDTATIRSWVKDEREVNVRRLRGRGMFNYMWTHRTPDSVLVNPSPTNIHDMFIITSSYYNLITSWLKGELTQKPLPPTSTALALQYQHILDKKMVSDTVIMKCGSIKLLFGNKADNELRAKFHVVRSSESRKTDNNLKASVSALINEFFNITQWEFGETFFFSELEHYVMSNMGSDIRSILLVPIHPNFTYGDLLQISCREDEVLLGYVTDDDISIASSITPQSLGR